MAVSKRTRFEVLRRDNHTCRYCNASNAPLTVDHVTPVALGGTDTPDNLVAACRDCNAGKASTSPDSRMVADVSADLVRWARAMQAAVNIRSAMREERDQYAATATWCWSQWKYGHAGLPLPKPGDWLVTLWRFFEAGLPIEDLEDAITIACSNTKVTPDNTWRYMCGVAWNLMQKTQQTAREQLEWFGED